MSDRPPLLLPCCCDCQEQQPKSRRRTRSIRRRLTTVLVSLMVSGGLVLCVFGGLSCDFLTVQITSSDNVLITSWGEEVNTDISSASIGVNCLDDEQEQQQQEQQGQLQLQEQDQDEIDSSAATTSTVISFYDESDRMWNLSRIFWFSGMGCGGLTVLWSWLLSTCIVPYPQWRWRLLSILAAITAVLQVPIFLIFESDTCNYDINRQRCYLSYGAYMNIASIVLWILTTLAIQCIRPPRWDLDVTMSDDDDDDGNGHGNGVWRTVTHIRPTKSISVVMNDDGNNNNNNLTGNSPPTDGTSTEGGMSLSSPTQPWPLSPTPSTSLDQNQYQQQRKLSAAEEEEPYPYQRYEVSYAGSDFDDNDDDTNNDDNNNTNEGMDASQHGDENQNENNANANADASMVDPRVGLNHVDKDGDNMSETDHVIFNGVNDCQTFRVDPETKHEDDSGNNQNGRNSSNNINSNDTRNNGQSQPSGFKVSYVYPDGSRQETRFPPPATTNAVTSSSAVSSSAAAAAAVAVAAATNTVQSSSSVAASACINMAGTIQTFCPIPSLMDDDDDDDDDNGVGTGNDTEQQPKRNKKSKKQGFIDEAGDWACGGVNVGIGDGGADGEEINESMRMDYLTRRMMSDVVAVPFSEADNVCHQIQDDVHGVWGELGRGGGITMATGGPGHQVPFDTIEIDMARNKVKSTVGLTGVEDRSNSNRGGGSSYQADDVSEMTKGTGLASGVSDVLDSGQDATMSILEDLARPY